MKSDSDRVFEYLNYLAVEKALAANTLIAYRKDLERFLDFTQSNGFDIDSLNLEIMSEFVAWLRGKNSDFPPLSESSISRMVVSIRNFAKFDAKESGKTNPIQEFHPPKIPKRLPKSLTVAEIDQLISHASNKEDPITLRDLALIEFLYATGARISEVLNLTLADMASIKDDGGFAVKLKGKGGKERIVPVGSFARAALADYLVRTRPLLAKSKTNNWLFLNLRGQKLSRQSAWQIISDVAKRAKISREVTPNALRHSFATHLLDGGADIRVVQELLGHSSVTTTQIYTLITIDKLRESYALAHPRAK